MHYLQHLKHIYESPNQPTLNNPPTPTSPILYTVYPLQKLRCMFSFWIKIHVWLHYPLFMYYIPTLHFSRTKQVHSKLTGWNYHKLVFICKELFSNTYLGKLHSFPHISILQLRLQTKWNYCKLISLCDELFCKLTSIHCITSSPNADIQVLFSWNSWHFRFYVYFLGALTVHSNQLYNNWSVTVLHVFFFQHKPTKVIVECQLSNKKKKTFFAIQNITTLSQNSWSMDWK